MAAAALFFTGGYMTCIEIEERMFDFLVKCWFAEDEDWESLAKESEELYHLGDGDKAAEEFCHARVLEVIELVEHKYRRKTKPKV